MKFYSNVVVVVSASCDAVRLGFELLNIVECPHPHMWQLWRWSYWGRLAASSRKPTLYNMLYPHDQPGHQLHHQMYKVGPELHRHHQHHLHHHLARPFLIILVNVVNNFPHNSVVVYNASERKQKEITRSLFLICTYLKSTFTSVK